MINLEDIQDMLEMGMSFNEVDFTPDPVREQQPPRTRYERYQRYINNIAPLFNEFDDWGGSGESRNMAMKLYPYEEWIG